MIMFDLNLDPGQVLIINIVENYMGKRLGKQISTIY